MAVHVLKKRVQTSPDVMILIDSFIKHTPQISTPPERLNTEGLTILDTHTFKSAWPASQSRGKETGCTPSITYWKPVQSVHKLDNRNSQTTVFSTTTETCTAHWLDYFMIILSYRNQVSFNHWLHNRPNCEQKSYCIHTLAFRRGRSRLDSIFYLSNTVKSHLKH